MIQNRNCNKKGISVLISCVVIGWFLLSVMVQHTIAAPQIDVRAYIEDSKNDTGLDGTYDIRFAIYTVGREATDPYPSDTDAGAKIWEEVQQMKVNDGMLEAHLGTVQELPTNLKGNTDYYLGIRIGNDSEMVPRKKIAPNLLVLNAVNAWSLDGKVIGTQAGQIPLIGDNGKFNLNLMPTGTGNNELVIGNDNRLHDELSVAGNFSYAALSGQVLTLKAIDLSTDVTNTLGVGKGGTGLDMAPDDGHILVGKNGKYELNKFEAGEGVSIVQSNNKLTISAISNGNDIAPVVMVEGEPVSLLANDAGYITDGNFGWDNTYGLITDGNINWDNTYGFITDGNTNWDNLYGFITDSNDPVSGDELDAVITTIGLVRRTAAGTYDTITDNSANWNAAYVWGDHATQGYIIDGNTGWDNVYGFIVDGNTNWDNNYGFITNLSSFTTDNLAQGSANLYSQWGTNGTSVYYNGGNVGIGTSSPTALLSVAGDIKFQGVGTFSLTGGERDGLTIRTGDSYYSTRSIDFQIDSDPDPGEITYKNILSINNSGLSFSAANDPQYISGPSLRTLVIRGADHNDYGDEIGFDIDTDLVTGGAQYSRVLTIDSANGGSVGIGTQSPAMKLHVVGDGTNAATFMSGNIGIGTTSPGMLLDVNGYVRATRFYAGSTGLEIFNDRISPSGNFNGGIFFNNDILSLRTQDAGGYISFSPALAEAMRIIDSGNVGIGTTNPGYSLTVMPSGGTVNTTAFFQDVTPTTGSTQVTVKEGAVSGAEIFRVLANNNQLLLGVSGFGNYGGVKVSTLWSTGNTLALHGGYIGAGNAYSVRVSGTSNMFSHTSGTSGAFDITYNASAGAFDPSSGNGIFNTVNLAPHINQTGTATGISRGLYINPTLASAYDWRGIEIASDQGYGIYQSGASAKNYFAGNVGIGTTNPTAVLTFASSTIAAGGINLGGVTLYRDANSYLTTDNDLNVRGGDIFNTNGNLEFTPNYNSYVHFGHYGGSWQPGSGTPSYFSINGESYLVGGVQASILRQYGNMYMGGGGTTTGSWTGANLNLTYGKGAVDVYNGSAPITALGVTPVINVATTSTSGYAALLVNATETSVSATAQNYLARFQTSGSDKLVITSTGRLGIGTTNPQKPLHIIGADNDSMAYFQNATGSGGVRISANGANQSGKIEFLSGGGNPSVTITGGSGCCSFSINGDTFGAAHMAGFQSYGFGTYPYNADFEIQGTQTASSGIGRGTFIKQTISAAANNDYLYGLIIDPTFTNGSYTGVRNVGLAVTRGNVGIGTTNPGALLSLTQNNFGSGSGLRINNDINSRSVEMYIDGMNRPVINSGGDSLLFLDSGEVMRISGGNVGIGSTNPGYTLHVSRTGDGDVAGFTDSNGTCRINPTNTALDCSSDARLKRDVATIENALERTLSLRGVTFQWIKERGGNDHLGFVAQEVEQLFPELVTSHSDGYKSVNYTGFAPILVEAIKEQQVSIEQMDNRIANELATLLNRETTVDEQVSIISNAVVQMDERSRDQDMRLMTVEQGQQRETQRIDEQLAQLTVTVDTLNQLAAQVITQVTDHEQRIQALEVAVKEPQPSLDISSAALDTFARQLEYLDTNGEPLFTIEGDIKVAGVHTEKVDTEQIKVGTEASGKAMIEAGQRELVIHTAKVSTDSKIYITPEGSTYGKILYYTAVKEGKSFTVTFDGPEVDQDIRFNWLVIE